MGAKYYWQTSVVDGASSVTFNTQSISFNYGRTQPTDDFSTATLQLSGILPDSLPSAAKVVGNTLKVELKAVSGSLPFPFEYVFYLKQFSRTYGTTANLDTWSIIAHGVIGELTRSQLTADYSTTAGLTTINQASNIASTRAGITPSTTQGFSSVSGTTFTPGTYVNDVVQTLMRTEQGRMTDCFGELTLYGRYESAGSSVFTNFDDGTTTTTLPVTKYTEVEFVNDGDYLANTVVVQPEGLAAVSTGSVQPTLSFNTLDNSTTQATGLAQYIQSTINLNTVRPLSVRILADAQTNHQWIYSLPPRNIVTLGLRSTSYNCVVEGVSFSISPSATFVTYHLSSAEAYAFLRLDNSIFGKLDSNRLGF
jgi:hypothetical protein